MFANSAGMLENAESKANDCNIHRKYSVSIAALPSEQVLYWLPDMTFKVSTAKVKNITRVKPLICGTLNAKTVVVVDSMASKCLKERVPV